MHDYDTLDSTNLINFFTYKNSNQNKMDVVFKPDTSNNFLSILSLKMGGDGIGYNLNNSDSDSDCGSQTDISGKEQEKKEEKSIYSIGKSPVNGFFIGSVTVLGLFLLFRLLQKTK